MSENSKIEWCDHTFNPWEGCTKVSPGCVNCYAEARNNRFKGGNWGKGKPRRRTSAANWAKPLRWNRKLVCEECGNPAEPFEPNSKGRLRCFCACGGSMVSRWARRPRVFCASLADIMDQEILLAWQDDLLALITATPHIDWLLLTKRPEMVLPTLDDLRRMTWPKSREMADRWFNGDPPKNVWLGTSVENQAVADNRILELLKIPAKVRFLSVEPMLEGINLRRFFCHSIRCAACPRPGEPMSWAPATDCGCAKIHWAIFGGESGRGARPCNVEWIRDGVKQCQAAGVKVFVKQLGANVTTDEATPDGWPVGTEFAWRNDQLTQVCLQHPKGGDLAEWPEDLRVREFPEVPRD